MQVEQVLADYCAGVLDGSIVACRYVRLAVERHLRDLKTGAERGLYFDLDEAQRFVDFVGLLRHVKGRQWAGQPIELEPWQVFVYANVFGWRHERTKLRRFRTAYNEIARKNAKTTMAAPVGLWGLVADGEAGAEVYAAATKRDQAKICWDVARQMVQKAPALSRRVGVYKGTSTLTFEEMGSKFVPLGKDADTLDGLNPSVVIIDELHAHRTRELWDVIESGTGARAQPLLFAITTAGFDQDGICYTVRKDAISILESQHEDDTIFAYIATLDEGDDWQDAKNWRKANPNLGVSVSEEYLANQVAQAVRMPSKQPGVKTKNLNLWVSSASCWMPRETWAACGTEVPIEELRGRRCWGGLDLASVSDIGALVLAFEPIDGVYPILLRAWCPRNSAVQRSHDDKVPYIQWAADFESTGLRLTEGNRTDFKAIESDITALGSMFNIVHIAADPWNLEYMRQNLSDIGCEIIEHRQGFQSMSPAIRHVERLILGGEVAHGNNPLLAWAVGNVVSETDPQNNIRFSKKKSTEKIDPAVAMVMALGRAVLDVPEQSPLIEVW